MTTTVRCQRCRANISVSAQAQAVRCPMCAAVISLRPNPGRYGPPAAQYGPQLQQPSPRPRPCAPNMQYVPQLQHVSQQPPPPAMNMQYGQPQMSPRPRPAADVQYGPPQMSPRPRPAADMQYGPPQMSPRPRPLPAEEIQYGPQQTQLQQQMSPRPRPAAEMQQYGPQMQHYGPPPQHQMSQSPRPRPRPGPGPGPGPVQYYPKRAVLCGISYRGTDKYLKGSINDVNSMKYFLTNSMGFQSEAIIVLTEEETDPTHIPTLDNIRRAMQWLVQGCRSGDSLVFHYSGHATRTTDLDGDEVDGKDECLCPVDYKTRGNIVDDEINETLVRPLPQGAKLHAIIDTCFSGTLLDLPFLCISDWQGYFWDDHRTSYHNKGTSGGMAVCFSACEDHQNSGDTTVFTGGISTGAMTHSFIKAVESQTAPTYGGLLTAIRNKIHEAQKLIGAPTVQDAQLSASNKFDINSLKFVL